MASHHHEYSTSSAVSHIIPPLSTSPPNPSFTGFSPLNRPNLASRHRLRNQSLKRQLLLFQIITTTILDLELAHGIREGRLDFFLGAALELERHGGVRGDFLDA